MLLLGNAIAETAQKPQSQPPAKAEPASPTDGVATAPGAPAVPAQPAVLDLDDFPALVIDQVVIPVPDEIFGILDKLGEPNWDGQVRVPERFVTKDRLRLALYLGASIADGFVALQAEQGDKIQLIGQEILDQAGALGIRQSVMPHCQSIIDSANKGEWAQVRKELDNTQKTVRDVLNQMRDAELADCVSVGGWLRGTQVLTALINEAYSQDTAELLNQPELVKHFQARIEEAGLKAVPADGQLLSEVREGLDEISAAMSRDAEEIGPDTVVEIHATCSRLLDRFYANQRISALGPR